MLVRWVVFRYLSYQVLLSTGLTTASRLGSLEHRVCVVLGLLEPKIWLRGYGSRCYFLLGAVVVVPLCPYRWCFGAAASGQPMM